MFALRCKKLFESYVQGDEADNMEVDALRSNLSTLDDGNAGIFHVSLLVLVIYYN